MAWKDFTWWALVTCFFYYSPFVLLLTEHWSFCCSLMFQMPPPPPWSFCSRLFLSWDTLLPNTYLVNSLTAISSLLKFHLLNEGYLNHCRNTADLLSCPGIARSPLHRPTFFFLLHSLNFTFYHTLSSIYVLSDFPAWIVRSMRTDIFVLVTHVFEDFRAAPGTK